MAGARDNTTTALMAIAALVWTIAGVLAIRSTTKDPPPAPAATAPQTTAAPSGKPSAAPSVTATAAATSKPTAKPAAEPAKSPTACVSALLVTEGVDYDFICKQTNPLKASGRVKSALVRNGKGLVTDAMRQWAGLGWYEMAAFTMLRAHCCAAGDALVYNFTLACPLDEAVNELDAAVRTGEREAIEGAVKRYTKEARCLDQFGQSRNMGRDAPPGAGIAALRRLIDKMMGG